MIKCKLFILEGDMDYYDNYRYFLDQSFPWDELEEADFKLLQKHIGRLNSYCSSNKRFVLISIDMIPIKERVESIKEFLKKEEEQKAIEKKRSEEKAKKDLAKKAKSIQQKKELLETLKKELGET